MNGTAVSSPNERKCKAILNDNEGSARKEPDNNFGRFPADFKIVSTGISYNSHWNKLQFALE